MIEELDADPVSPPTRDSVSALSTEEEPTIVTISDIHGHLGDARSALLTLADHPEYNAIVETDAARRLQWTGGEEYVLVFNGDLVDRGPQSDRVLEMVARLIEQAPSGHIRVTLGNHEMGMLTPDRFGWQGWFSAERSDEQRAQFIQHILDGHVVAAYEGHNVTFAHAGRPEPYDAGDLNSQFVTAAEELQDALGTGEEIDTQHALIEAYPAVFGVDGRTGRGPGAGIAWLDFEFMPDDAPPQIVGHTRHDKPTQGGNVICGNVIRNNRRADGGEGIVIETSDRIVALCRGEDEQLAEYEFSIPASQNSNA